MGNGPKIWTVGEVVRQAKDALRRDDALRSVIVEGEVSDFKPHASGHWYFTLKDERSLIGAIMFSRTNQRVSFLVKNGMRVRIFGSVTVWETRGQMQLVAESMQKAGIGDILLRIHELKERLRKEGLFDAKKAPLPRHPSAVAIVTSADGAALRDVAKVLRKRAPYADLLLSPCQVQGEGASTSIVRALRMADASRAEVVIVGRGGGSFEDLLPFQSEEVVRAVGAMAKPVISAVGHQTDSVMTDDAADARAATPSEAAEMAAGDAASAVQELDATSSLMRSVAFSSLENLESQLRRSESSLAVRREISRLESVRAEVSAITGSMVKSASCSLAGHESALASLASSVSAMNPRGTLARGYALAESEGGGALASARDFRDGMRYSLRMKDGKVISIVESMEED